ncbi:MAG: flagellar hook-associated protein FlgK [Lachnospirales bacterium]
MSGLGTLGVAVSGLNAAQIGLGVVGHNLANVNTTGYTRQQLIQTDFYYKTVGVNGNSTLQIGLGTTSAGVRQIRDKFLDMQYRNENSKLGYYEATYEAGTEIEELLSELQGEYSTQEVYSDFWDSLQELSMNPESIDARGNFINTARSLIDKMNSVYNNLVEYQHNLDDQIQSTVTEINSLTKQVNELNNLIEKSEASGDNANDYRDMRNNAIDRLTELTGCNVKERSDGSVDLFIEGHPLISNGTVFNVGLKYTDSSYSFVEPVFTDSDEILPANEDDVVSLYKLTSSVSSVYKNDNSVLKGLLVSRGTKPENWMSAPQAPDVTDTSLYPLGSSDVQYQKDYQAYKKAVFNVTEATIPSTMKKLDTIFHSVVTLVNDTLAPKVQKDFDDPTNTDPMGLDGTQYEEVFVRKNYDRYDSSGNYIEEVEGDVLTMYTIGNVEINPDFLDADGYDKIPLSPALGGSGSGTNECDVSNNTIIEQLIDAYDDDTINVIIGKDKDGNYITSGQPTNIKNGYARTVTELATRNNEAKNYIEQQEIIITQLENNRLAMSGVSMDEELTYMMQYQHAYNASARVVNIVDGMIDRIVNNTGRVGL